MDRRAFILTAPLALAACGNSVTWAPDDFVSRSTYVEPGPKYIKLFTVRNTGSDNGAHSGLLINASQRVLWDPAGSFGHSSIPERNDVLFGISPRVEQAYISYHSRVTYYTQIQQFMLSPDVAELALRLAMENGPTPKILLHDPHIAHADAVAGVRVDPHDHFPEQPGRPDGQTARRDRQRIPGNRCRRPRRGPRGGRR